jgi:HK97 family phage prohead protease
MSADIYRFFEVKEIGEDGSFTGIASVYGEEDLGGDVIDKGAFRKTISESPEIPILWQHKPDEVIGSGTVKEWQNKILLEGKLDLEDPTALKAYRKLKGRLIKGLSIGFRTMKSSWEKVEGRMIRHISELKLFEVSVVTFPMLPSAQVTRVKHAEESELIDRIIGNEEFRKQVQALLAANATPQETAEPAQAKEPPPQQATEPEALHSIDTDALLDDFRAKLGLVA